jgi:hypothetical protein
VFCPPTALGDQTRAIAATEDLVLAMGDEAWGGAIWILADPKVTELVEYEQST